MDFRRYRKLKLRILSENRHKSSREIILNRSVHYEICVDNIYVYVYCIYVILKIEKVLIAGEISHQLVNELIVLTEEILYPLLCNPKNHHNWPEVIKVDIKKHAYNFKNILYQVSILTFSNNPHLLNNNETCIETDSRGNEFPGNVADA